jgi:hypothetical protein
MRQSMMVIKTVRLNFTGLIKLERTPMAKKIPHGSDTFVMKRISRTGAKLKSAMLIEAQMIYSV